MALTRLALWTVTALIIFSANGLLAEQASFEGKTVSQWMADLSSPDAAVRSKAAVALGKLGDAAVDAIGKLADQLEDKNEEARANAAWALGAIGWDDDYAVKALTRALDDASPGVRGRAAVALGRIGTDSPEAIAKITSLAENDKDERVRRSARDAVKALVPSEQDKPEYVAPPQQTESETSDSDTPSLLSATPDDLTEFLGPLRRHKDKLTAVGLKVLSIEENPAPKTREEARKWAEDTRAVGREMVAEFKAYSNTLHDFINGKTRKGLAEEIELVRSNTELVYQIIGQYQSAAHVEKKSIRSAVIKDAIIKEAKAYLLSRVKKRIADRLDNEGLRELLNSKSWEEAFNKTLSAVRKNAESELDKATQKAFGLPFHDEQSLKTALKQRFYEVAEKAIAKITIKLAANGIVIKVGARAVIEWLEKNWWPHVREALREKGKFDIRVPQSIKTLEAARLALYRLPNDAPITEVRKALNSAKGKLHATRYLEKDLKNAKNADLLKKLKDAQSGLEQVMDITAHRFMLSHREAVEKLGKSEEELKLLIWMTQILVDSVKEPPVKEEEKKPVKAEPKPAQKQEEPKPAAHEGAEKIMGNVIYEPTPDEQKSRGMKPGTAGNVDVKIDPATFPMNVKVTIQLTPTVMTQASKHDPLHELTYLLRTSFPLNGYKEPDGRHSFTASNIEFKGTHQFDYYAKLSIRFVVSGDGSYAEGEVTSASPFKGTFRFKGPTSR